MGIKKELLLKSGYSKVRIVSKTFFTKGQFAIVEGRGRRIYVCNINTAERYANKNGYKTTQEAIEACEQVIQEKATRVSVYENGMIVSDGAEEVIGAILDEWSKNE